MGDKTEISVGLGARPVGSGWGSNLAHRFGLRVTRNALPARDLTSPGIVDVKDDFYSKKPFFLPSFKKRENGKEASSRREREMCLHATCFSP